MCRCGDQSVKVLVFVRQVLCEGVGVFFFPFLCVFVVDNLLLLLLPVPTNVAQNMSNA